MSQVLHLEGYLTGLQDGYSSLNPASTSQSSSPTTITPAFLRLHLDFALFKMSTVLASTASIHAPFGNNLASKTSICGITCSATSRDDAPLVAHTEGEIAKIMDKDKYVLSITISFLPDFKSIYALSNSDTSTATQDGLEEHTTERHNMYVF